MYLLRLKEITNENSVIVVFVLLWIYPWQIKINVLWMAIIITNEHKMTQQLLVIK